MPQCPSCDALIAIDASICSNCGDEITVGRTPQRQGFAWGRWGTLILTLGQFSIALAVVLLLVSSGRQILLGNPLSGMLVATVGGLICSALFVSFVRVQDL